MSENLTKNLPDGDRTFEQQVLADLARMFTEFDKVNARLTALEEKVDSRLRETRPIWEAVQNMLEDLNAQMKLLVADLFRMRARVERMEELQRPPAA